MVYIIGPFFIYFILKKVWSFPYEEIGNKEGWLGFLGGYLGFGGTVLIFYTASNNQKKEKLD